MSHKKRYWIESGLLTVLQNFSGVFFGFGSFYLLVRVLDSHNFGIWVLFMSTITIAEAIRNGLIQSALIRFVSGAKQGEKPQIVASSMVLAALVTFFVLLASLLGAGFLSDLWKSPQLKGMIRLYNVGFIVSMWLMLFNCVEQANLQFRGVFLTGFIRQLIFFLFVAVVYFCKFPVELIDLVWVQVISVTISTGFAYLYTRNHFRMSFSNISTWLSKLFHFGKYGFGTSVSSLLSGTVDQMMLGALLSPAASGSFNIAVRITNLIDIPTNAMAAIVFPQSAKRLEEQGSVAIKYLYEKSVGITLAILFPGVLFIYFFADWVIWLIAGQKYTDSIPLLKVTLLYCLLIPFGRQFGTILDSAGKTKITFGVVLFTTLINLSLNFIFIKQWGVIGAAYATLCSNIVGFVIAQYWLRKMISVDLKNVFIYAGRFYPEFYHGYFLPAFQKLFSIKPKQP